MIIILIACIYISFICLGWGIGLLSFLKISKEEALVLPHPAFICLLGLSGIIAMSGLLSLFIPLGEWYLQVFLLIVAITSIFLPGKLIRKGVWKQVIPGHRLSLTLIICCGVLLTLMGSWEITHPDTLGYHAQTIEWIEKYKVVPGLAQINMRLGYQGLWFPACALFGFSFTGIGSVNFLNCALVCWLLLFLVGKIDHSITRKDAKGFLWLSLLIISLWSYTQIRLTITSASPDFIITILICSSFYLFLKNKSSLSLFTGIIFSFVAVAIKLSALPVALIGIYGLFILFKKKEIKSLMFALSIGFIVFSSFLVRNSVTTGYALYPSPFPDVIHADWKIDKDKMQEGKKYITAYAKTGVPYKADEIERTTRLHINEWMPVWWNNQSLPDKILLVFFLISILAAILFFKKLASAEVQTKIVLLCCATGIIFWFSTAPDPRFGAGFLISFIGLISSCALDNFPIISPGVKKFFLAGVAMVVISIIGYTGYRFAYFFSANQIVSPLGIKKTITRTIMLNGVKIKLPLGNDPNNNKNSTDSVNFSLRGTSITDGFRAKIRK
jgi:hypothetical protein